MTEGRLAKRLEQGPVICAEGYLFELERRGYLQAGPFVPEVSLEHPEALKQVHRDFCFCGSDVVVAFTYNGHREKMQLVGKEDLLEPLNRQALGLAREVAWEFSESRPLVAGNISNTNIFDPEDPTSKDKAYQMFTEMVGWAKEEGVDFVIAETIYFHEEAMLALGAIRKAGLEAVVTLGVMEAGVLNDGVAPEDSCAALEAEGASVVGLNCFRGPATMTGPLLKIREKVSGPVAALPVPYRTEPRHPTFFDLPDPGNRARLPHSTTFPTALDPLLCNRYEIAEFAGAMLDAGIHYLGLCCGATPAHIRALAEAAGRKTPASAYSVDMSRHFLFGTDPEAR
jgi:betaine-homocysteine S-methyltransferase